MARRRLIQEFLNSEKAGGLVLLGCTVLSLLLANSPWQQDYISLWHHAMPDHVGVWHIPASPELWINDGLMAIFFLLVGLEMRREVVSGELSRWKQAVLPVVAAIGGIVVPAAIYLAFNSRSETANGFGIPMATDIAFALGMLSLLGRRVPHGLKVFLTALAIIDDLGAILVIAIFYNTGISVFYLLLTLVLFGLLLLLKRMQVRFLTVYLVIGVLMWFTMLQSGVHATLSGVLLAITIPDNENRNHAAAVQHFLHKPVAFIVLPLFAFANTAIALKSGWLASLTTTNGIGIVAGLLVGKPVGIFLFSALLIWAGWAQLPKQVGLKQLFGAAVLGGIGFTMSIFIANLAFSSQDLIQDSKLAVLIASLLASIAGLLYLYGVLKKSRQS